MFWLEKEKWRLQDFEPILYQNDKVLLVNEQTC